MKRLIAHLNPIKFTDDVDLITDVTADKQPDRIRENLITHWHQDNLRLSYGPR